MSAMKFRLACLSVAAVCHKKFCPNCQEWPICKWNTALIVLVSRHWFIFLMCTLVNTLISYPSPSVWSLWLGKTNHKTNQSLQAFLAWNHFLHNAAGDENRNFHVSLQPAVITNIAVSALWWQREDSRLSRAIDVTQQQLRSFAVGAAGPAAPYRGSAAPSAGGGVSDISSVWRSSGSAAGGSAAR